MNPNTRSVLSSWFSGEERSSAQSMPSQEAPDYIYAPMHHKMEKRGAGRGRGAPHGARAPRSAGPSPIRPSQPGRGPNAGSYHHATTTEDYGVDGRAVPRGRQLRGSKEGGFSEHGALPTDVHKANARSHNAEPFDYHQVSPAVEKSWRAPRSHPSSAPTTPHKSRPPLKQRRSRFKEYLSSEDIEKGLKDGTLLEGVLRVNHKRMRLAYVSVEGFDKDVLIDGIYARNRAFEGDTVVIRLNDPSEWEVIKEDKDEDEDAVTDKEEDDDEEEEEEDDEDEAADAVLKPAPLKLVDDSLVDAMSDTDDDLAEVNVDVVSQAGTGESTVVEYKEAIDAEEAVSSRGWWQPSPATPVEAAVVPPAVEVPVAVPIDVAENRQAGKRCWRCQEVGHIARDCTNAEKPAAKTPIKAASTKTPAKQQQQGETKEPLGEGETAGKLRRTAKVVAIAKSSHIEEMVGYLKPCGLAEEEIGKGNFYAFFVPLEKRMPRILVPVKRLSGSLISHPDELTTNLFVCKLTGWPSSSSHPRGELVKNMGPSGDMEVELRVLLQDNNIDWEDSFTPDVLACLPVVPAPPARWAIPNEEVAARRDLRRERIFTIDPATAKDMDDAVSCKPLPDGSYLVGVHIADVTYFVKPDTPLDLDARKRATTVYMVHRSIPMLPRLLSDNMCSLVPGEDRLSFSVTWRMDKEGRVLEEPWFGRTIIRSCVKMSYEAAQQMLDGTFTEPSTEPAGDAATAPAPTKRGVVFAKDSTAPEHRVEQIVEDVRVLNGMAEALRRRRFEDGSLTLDDAKMYFCLDEMQMPTDVGTYVRTASHFLIEELMLLANKSVALRIHQAYPDRALLRRHPPPNDNKLAEFVTMCKANSIEFDTSCSKGFQRSLDQLKHLPNPDIAAVVTRLAMKPMSVAKYVCTDEEATDGTYHHYALAFDHYTHFTSPIRRYADVIVHRLLDACLQAQPAPLDKDDLCSICDNCNMRKNKADKAQDKCDLVFLCTLLKNHPPKDLEATVITVNSRSFEVYVPLYGVEKLAHADDMPLAKLDHDKKNQTLFLHWRAAAAASSDAVDAAADGDADNAPAEVTDDDADKAGDQKQSAKPQKKDKRRMQKKQAKFEGKTVVQEIKPFTRLRVRLYPDLQRRPIDVRLVVVPPEGVAVPDTYYNAPESVSRAATPAKQAHGRKQHQPSTPTHRQHQPHQPARHQPHPQVLHVEDDEESAIEDWVKSVREDDARQKQQIWDRIALFLNDPTQSKLHLPAELTAFERRLAHEIAEDHGLHHHSANFFCPETGAKERRLTLFKQAPQASAGGRSHSRSVPGPAALDAAGVADGADGVPVKTPTRGKRPPKPKSAVRAHPMPQHLAGEGVPLPADGADHQAAAAPHKKKVARGTRTKAKERAEAVKGQLEAAGIDLPDEGAAPAEVRTRVHRPKRAPKPRAVKPAAVQPPVEQQHPVVHDVPQQVEA